MLKFKLLVLCKFHQLIDVNNLGREDANQRSSRYKMNFLGMGESAEVLNPSKRRFAQ